MFSRFLGVACAMAAFGLAAPAQAVTGSMVDCTVSGAQLTSPCSPTSFTVTDGMATPDTQIGIAGGGGATLDVFFMGGWIDIILDSAIGGAGFSPGQQIEFSGLTDPLAPTVPLGLYGVTSSNVTGFDISNLLLSGDTLTIDLGGVTFGADGASIGFDVAVPLPASVLLLGSALLGLGAMRRRPRQPA